MTDVLVTLRQRIPSLSNAERRIVETVLENPGLVAESTITQLAEPAGMSLTGMKKHVRVLEEAQLVTTEKVGRTRWCRLGPRRLDDDPRLTRSARRSRQSAIPAPARAPAR